MAVLADTTVFWLTSRAAGIAALLCSSAAVAIGLTMGLKLTRGRASELRAAHEGLALATLAAVALHAAVLLLDPWLQPSVADLVVTQLVAWQEAGRRTSVAVNVPARSLGRPGFADDLGAQLRGAGLPQGVLTLEVTENELIDDAAREAVRACRERGLAVAIDDFGMGYSALGYLLDVPATELKIDRSLVARVHEQPARRVLVAHCVSLAHALGVQVVAEGVETAEEQQALVELGADWVQGFHLHRPCAPEDLDG